jgi:hypothetical protein
VRHRRDQPDATGLIRLSLPLQKVRSPLPEHGDALAQSRAGVSLDVPRPTDDNRNCQPHLCCHCSRFAGSGGQTSRCFRVGGAKHLQVRVPRLDSSRDPAHFGQHDRHCEKAAPAPASQASARRWNPSRRSSPGRSPASVLQAAPPSTIMKHSTQTKQPVSVRQAEIRSRLPRRARECR